MDGDKEVEEKHCEFCKQYDATTTRPPPPWFRGSKAIRAQRKLSTLLESKRAHVAIILLTLLDLAIVITELSLFAFFPEEESVPESVKRAEDALSWTSITILSIFTLEQILKLVVFGIQYFFRLWHGTFFPVCWFIYSLPPFI